MEWGWRLMIRLVGERAGTEVGAELLLLLREAYPRTDFGTIFAFRRIFMVGEKQ